MTSFLRQRVFISAAFVFCMLAAPTLLAEVEVTLKSGATLVGQVKIDGADAVVTIDNSEVRVPLSEVDTIGSAADSPERQSHRLLLTALSARKTKDGGTEAIGLLAEAARLAPNDPHVAYWYASSLADAGFGQAANEILTKQREAVAKAYPGMIGQLESRIKRRVEMEKMPAGVIERFDALSAELAGQSPNAEQRQLAVLFRLVDQQGVPIERDDFEIQCNGHETNLEPFEDGYFIYLFKQSRGNGDQQCRLEVMRPGLEAKNFQFQGSSSQVGTAGTLVAKRYGEEARQPFRVTVSDSSGQPVVGARISLNPVSSGGNTSEHSLSGETDAEGKAEILAFPMKYSYRVSSQSFNPAGGAVEIRAAGGEPSEVKAQLYRAIQATIRLAWKSTSMQGGGTTSGEATLQVSSDGPPPHQYGQNDTNWIRPIQQKDRLTVQFVDNAFGFGGPFGVSDAWVRVVPAEKAEKEAEGEGEKDDAEGESKQDEPKPTRLEEFNGLDLEEIDKLKSKLPQPRLLGGGQPTGPRPPMVLEAEAGAIFVGRVLNRDMRTGQPIQLAFKAFVEEMATDEADE